MSLNPPTSAQGRVLESLDLLTDEWGTPPSLRDIGEELDLNASTVMRHLHALHESGWVIQTGQPSRNYRLSEEARKRSLITGRRKP